MNLKRSFLVHCDKNLFEINKDQLNIIDNLNNFYIENFNQNFFKKLFKKNSYKLGFYLVGDVGVGKTMILNFFFNQVKEKKLRLHFNEFMISFHDFVFQNKNKKEENIIDYFVNDLEKKTQLIYFDEFQVTNIVDAMILGKLFQKIFEEKIRVIFSSNIQINDLYKDGLQRDQFLPFIEILKKNSHEEILQINEDYRLNRNNKPNRFLLSTDKSTNFIFNKYFREITKNKKNNPKIIEVKGRKIELNNYYDGIVKLNFDELCNRNIGSEDYIKIAEISKFIFIEELLNFDENNFNQQQRFITFIDIIYEKKIPLMIKSKVDLKSIKSSKSLIKPFKRTISRLYELTSVEYN